MRNREGNKRQAQQQDAEQAARGKEYRRAAKKKFYSKLVWVKDQAQIVGPSRGYTSRVEAEKYKPNQEGLELLTGADLERRRRKIKNRELVYVIRGTADLVSKDHEDAEEITRAAYDKRYQKKTKAIAATSQKKRKRDWALIKVLTGSTTEYDFKAHAGQEFEEITKSALSARKLNRRKVKVLKDSIIEYDPQRHGSNAIIEEITKSALSARKLGRRTFKVLKGTPIIYDAQEHGSDAVTEKITHSALASRKENRKKYKVLKGKADKYDEQKHAGQEFEEITKIALNHRKYNTKKVRVLKGSTIIYEEQKHAGQAFEVVTKRILANRVYGRQQVKVLKGTADQYDEQKHAGQEFEVIAKTALRGRKLQREKVRVLKGSTTIYEEQKHAGQAFEVIAKTTVARRRRKQLKVSEATVVDTISEAGTFKPMPMSSTVRTNDKAVESSDKTSGFDTDVLIDEQFQMPEIPAMFPKPSLSEAQPSESFIGILGEAPEGSFSAEMLTDTEASTFALLEKFGIFSSPIEKEADQLLEHLANAELKDPSCTL